MLIKCAELHEPSFFSIASIRSLTHFQLLVVFKSASTWLQFLPLAKMHPCQVFFEKDTLPLAHGTGITDMVAPRETIKRAPSLDVWCSFPVRHSDSFCRWVQKTQCVVRPVTPSELPPCVHCYSSWCIHVESQVLGLLHQFVLLLSFSSSTRQALWGRLLLLLNIVRLLPKIVEQLSQHKLVIGSSHFPKIDRSLGKRNHCERPAFFESLSNLRLWSLLTFWLQFCLFRFVGNIPS